MAIVKSDIEILVELRDKVSFRLIELKDNFLYWQEVSKKAKKDSQDRVDSINNMALNQQNISKDTHFLKVIDKMLKEAK